MVVAGVVLGAIGVIGVLIGAVAIALGLISARTAKPVLRIVPRTWEPPEANYPMLFAAGRVINEPLDGWRRKYLQRDIAQACTITYEFWTWGDNASRKRAEGLPAQIKGRWDKQKEPMTWAFRSSRGTSSWRSRWRGGSSSGPGSTPSIPPGAGTAPSTSLEPYDEGPPYSFEPTRESDIDYRYSPQRASETQDISVGSDDDGEFSVAILKDREVFAFANESYRREYWPDRHLCKPEWQLRMGETYRVKVIVKASNVADPVEAAFKLYVTSDYRNFKLEPADD